MLLRVGLKMFINLGCSCCDFFFFQAEDGIRDLTVTGVQTCALPIYRAATLAEVERQVRQGTEVLDFENRYRHKDGSYRTLSWKSAPQPDGTMYATARDISERREAERRITELNRQLLQRQSSLEQANKELESFSYSVSHDLRAPLRHIDGYARMLREDVGPSLGEEPRRFLDTIVESARRMGLLIDDLLAFSRLGRKPLASRSVDMGE